jgi:UDP-glucose 4-epimerase
MNLKNKKIVLIGGAGLIGSYTLEKLLKKRVKEIIIYDNFTRGKYKNIEKSLKDPRVKIYDEGGDILQKDILLKALKGADGVCHFAALWLLQCHEYPESAFETNIRGTFNVMEACRINKIKKLVYSSSASVYGDAIHSPMREDHPYLNKNFYGATKICAEALLRSYYYRYNLNYVGLRYMNVYGPRQDYKGAYIAVMMRMIDNIQKGKQPIIIGTGNEGFDFVSVRDCAEANVCALEAETFNEFYNVGTGKKTTLKTLALKILKLMNSDLKINYQKSRNLTLVKSRIGSITKAKKEIKYKYKINLEKGLKELIDWKKRLKN